MARPFRKCDFTAEFFETFGRFAKPDQRRFVRALVLLDEDEKHPSLRVHELSGDLRGMWSASASDQLRIIFLRSERGRRTLIRCTRHYA